MVFWQLSPSTARRRRPVVLGACVILFLIVLSLYHHSSNQLSTIVPASWPYKPDNQNTASPSSSTLPSTVDKTLIKQQARFWRSVYQIILNNDPQCKKKPEIVVPAKLDVAYQDDHLHPRPDIMWMDEPDIQRMKIAHSNFVNDIRSTNLELVYKKGTRGIVSTVSDQQLPVFLVSVRMLRQSGSVLPVELFLWSPTTYTNNMCGNLLPTLNVTCIFLADLFHEASTGVDIDHYQYKIFTLLFSSFDELLFLDADAWPAANPDHIFDSQPFTDTGLVLWPDFWYCSESPYFFQIAKIDNPPELSERAATEAGAIMYAKNKHEASIMLATYYNYYGPDYYYPLQSQGGSGQGDKETFGLAALALNEPFYPVKARVTALGRGDSSGKWYGSAMVQHDPIFDYQYHQTLQKSASDTGSTDADKSSSSSDSLTPVPDEELNYREKNENSPPSIIQAAAEFVNMSTEGITSKPLFIHANFPKFDPRTIFEENVNGAQTPTRDSNGTYVRCWGMTAEVAVEKFGYDIEEQFWDIIRKVACRDLVGAGSFNDIEAERDVCKKVEKYYVDIFH